MEIRGVSFSIYICEVYGKLIGWNGHNIYQNHVCEMLPTLLVYNRCLGWGRKPNLT